MGEPLLGVVVAGSAPLDAVLANDDAALTPFAGRYCFLDLAVAVLADAGAAAIYVLAPPPARALSAHLASTAAGVPARTRVQLRCLPLSPATNVRARMAQLLVACGELAQRHRATAVAVLGADHVLRLDLRTLLAARRRSEADVLLAALPVRTDETALRTILDLDGDGRVRAVHDGSSTNVLRIGTTFTPSWAGDFVMTGTAARRGGPRLLDGLVAERRIAAVDVEDVAGGRAASYWHAPATLEDYYLAHMELCSPRPPVDLHDGAWPAAAVAGERGPARLVVDDVGRPAQALNALVCDGAVLRGGVVMNTIVGPGARVEGGAEVEDAILLAGCRVGRHARVRRTIVGAGAVLDDGVEIGFGDPPPGAHRRPSGLTVVPGAAGGPPTAVAIAR